MKKFYIIFILLAFIVCTASAQNGFAYGYSSDNINGVGSNSGLSNYWIAAAFQMTQADTERFDGCEITGVSIGFGSGRNKDLTIFFTDELTSEPTATFQGRVRPNQWNDIELLSPVKIEKGKPFYVGYKYNVTNNAAMPIGTDENTITYTPTADLISIAETESAIAGSWQHYGANFGNVCLRVYISGSSVSETNCIPQTLDLPSLAHPGQPFDFALNFTNASAATINSIEVVYQIGDDSEKTITQTFTPAIEANAKGQVKITDCTDQDNFSLPIKARITKVNGKPNDVADMEISTTFVCTNGLFERKVVVEKYTGNHCQFCPRGIVAFDYMNGKYYGNFIGIAIHNYPNDPMSCSSYSDFMNWMNPSGAPNVIVDRDKSLTRTAEKGAIENAFLIEFTDACEIGIFASYEKSSSSNAINATGTVKVAHDMDGANLAMTFVITEDEVGPYYQTNGFSNSTGLPEWADKPSYVSMKYDDVARYIHNDWNGIPGSVPATLKAGQEYAYTVNNLSLGNTENINKANLIALLIDKSTGIIVNADRVYLDGNRQPPVSGIKEVATLSNSRIYTADGEIRYQGGDKAQVYTLSGMHAGSISDGSTLSVAPGIYIVKVAGFSRKVIVK